MSGKRSVLDEDPDAFEKARFKRELKRSEAHRISPEAVRLADLKRWAVHLMDPDRGDCVVREYAFRSEASAEWAIAHARELAGGKS